MKLPNYTMISIGGLATETYRIYFCMKHFGAKTSKPTMLLSNLPAICRHHRPRRQGKRKPRHQKKAISLCRKYVDKAGKPRFAGTARLKKSQSLGKKTIAGNHGNWLEIPEWMKTKSYIERLFETLCFWACMLFHVISIRPWPRIYPARFAAAMVHAIPASKWTRSSFAMNAACLLKLPVLSLTWWRTTSWYTKWTQSHPIIPW